MLVIPPPKPKCDLPVVYLSGPMSGIPDDNFPAFNSLANRLRGLGFPVVNPADFGHIREGSRYGDALARDLAFLPAVDVVVLLEGYEASTGADLEMRLAKSLQLQIIHPNHRERFIRRHFDEDTLMEWCRVQSLHELAYNSAVDQRRRAAEEAGQHRRNQTARVIEQSRDNPFRGNEAAGPPRDGYADLMSKGVECLKFPAVLARRLHHCALDTVGQLTSMQSSELRWLGLDDGEVSRVRLALALKGLALKGEIPSRRGEAA